MEEAPWGTFQDELDWCIQQLQTDLLTDNTNPHEVEERERVLNFLQSQGAPSVRKRQVMQMIFGDYRQRMTEEQKPQEETVGPEMQGGVADREALFHRSREERFAWIPSNNSFTFNFFPDGIPVYTCTPTQETRPSGTVPLTGEGSGFAFNFQIPEERPIETKPESTDSIGPNAAADDRGADRDGSSGNQQDSKQSSLPPPSKSKKKKKNNKKKHTAEGAEDQKKQSAESHGAAASHTGETVLLSAEQQLVRELDWCVEQLELGLRTQKSSPKQMEEASRALKTLRSNKAPLVKKRQVMRAMFGDYRKKMEEDKAKQVKLIHAAVKSARVTAVLEPAKKPVFHRRAECRTPTQPQKSDAQSQEPGPISESFVFVPTQEEFCFNFF
ncbi:UPF0488 protein C8orf33 homolog isoform X1 [Anguilla anguilla]|uniref:UPF0488 protein C8orf33 homolog isoform X1 n=1 Tax=Anguilla anguilla TaxID=7936 RepID=UPI0015AA4A0F|nr:UPF0488 protein C8orf33 homolog isoform X1 [Anguilla anguilla]